MKKSIITALKANAIALLIFAFGAVVSTLMNKFEFMWYAVYVATLLMLISFIAREIDERKNKKRYYFVSYYCNGRFCYSFFCSNGLLNTDELRTLIADEINSNYREIAILNYKEISKKEYDINMKGDK